MDKSNWTPSEHQGYIVSMPCESQREAALGEVPAEFRARVEQHVRSAMAFLEYRRRMTARW